MRIPMISEKDFLTWKGNILLFWVKLAGLSKCIHISALTAWSTNKKRQQQSLMKYKTKLKCITTYVSSLLVVRTVVPTGKKRSQKKRWTDKTLVNNCKQQKVGYFVKLSISTHLQTGLLHQDAHTHLKIVPKVAICLEKCTTWPL